MELHERDEVPGQVYYHNVCLTLWNLRPRGEFRTSRLYNNNNYCLNNFKFRIQHYIILGIEGAKQKSQDCIANNLSLDIFRSTLAYLK